MTEHTENQIMFTSADEQAFWDRALMVMAQYHATVKAAHLDPTTSMTAAADTMLVARRERSANLDQSLAAAWHKGRP